MNGYSGIFSFPFRFYGPPGLGDAVAEGDGTVVRVYAPVELRGKGTPLSPDYPPEAWPEFRWNQWVGRADKVMPPRAFGVRPNLGGAAYDGFRADYWKEGLAEGGLQEFVSAFLGRLRLYSGQDWISRYEVHGEPGQKYGFAIDKRGRANGPPYAHGVSVTGHPWTVPVSQDIWERAAEHALTKGPVPEYWILFQDGCMATTLRDFRSAVMGLVLSIEVARNQLLATFAESEEDPVLGTVLGPPFADTDLLKHLTTRLEKAHPQKANAAEALPDQWPWIKRLYIARHKVAHGGPPATLTEAGMVTLTAEHLHVMASSVHQLLNWLESVAAPS